MRHRLVGLVVLSLVVITLPAAIASLFANLGAIQVLRTNQSILNDAVHCTCGDFEYSAGTGFWQLALRVHENARANFWLGQAELQQGHYTTAIERFLGAQRVSRDAFTSLGLLAAYDGAGDYQGVIETYEESLSTDRAATCQFTALYRSDLGAQACTGAFHQRVLRNVIAANYLRRAERQIEQGDYQEAEENLCHAWRMRPVDLYLAGRIAAIPCGLDTGDWPARVQWKDNTHFPIDSIDPVDRRLTARTVELIPRLLETGQWSPVTTQQVLSFLVWQYPDTPELEMGLRYLARTQSDDEPWVNLLGELLLRQGRAREAKDIFILLSQTHPDQPQYLRKLAWTMELMALQVPANEQMSLQQEAYQFYQRYATLAPTDLFGLYRLMTLADVLGLPQVIEPSLFDPEAHVAQHLGLHREQVELGPNLLTNGGFQQWSHGRFVSWVWSDAFNSQETRPAAFAGGPDDFLPLFPPFSARMDGFWIGTGENLKPATAGYWYWDETRRGYGELVLEPDTLYSVFILYRTEGAERVQLAIWLTGEYGDMPLPETNGEWRTFVWSFRTEDTPLPVFPVIRLWSPGTAWVASFRLSPVLVAGDRSASTGR
ncbi:MAG: tetratricopeptide repeat protein [Armatimonadota bacterium]